MISWGTKVPDARAAYPVFDFVFNSSFEFGSNFSNTHSQVSHFTISGVLTSPGKGGSGSKGGLERTKLVGADDRAESSTRNKRPGRLSRERAEISTDLVSF